MADYKLTTQKVFLELKKWLEHLVKEEIIEKDTYLYHLQNIQRLEL